MALLAVSQRFPDTIGLVLERERLSGELDGLRWYVDCTVCCCMRAVACFGSLRAHHPVWLGQVCG